MERPAYKKLMDFRADLQRRAAQLRGREREIINSLATQEAGLDEAIITGGHQIVQEQIANLKTELASIQRELKALDNPPRTGILGDLVRGVWEEATDEITVDLRREWDAGVLELERARAMFLAAVAVLGEIKRKADSISSRITEAILAMPGPKLATPSLTTGIVSRPDRHEGPIFINPQESEKAFKGA
jgi:hypothetical protein